MEYLTGFYQGRPVTGYSCAAEVGAWVKFDERSAARGLNVKSGSSGLNF